MITIIVLQFNISVFLKYIEIANSVKPLTGRLSLTILIRGRPLVDKDGTTPQIKTHFYTYNIADVASCTTFHRGGVVINTEIQEISNSSRQKSSRNNHEWLISFLRETKIHYCQFPKISKHNFKIFGLALSLPLNRK